MSLPPLTALRAFEAAIRHGRMTRAADELGVTHGAISRQVRLLEESFGAQLIARTRNGLVPTEAGAALAERLGRGFREIEAGVAALRNDAAGVLDVSCLGTFTLRWLIPHLGRFTATHPGIEVRLSQSDAPCDFSRGRYDVAIRVTDHELPEGTHVTPLFTEHFYFMLEAASAGLGVAIAPEPHVADDLAAGRLIAPFGFLPSGLSYVALRRQDAPKKARTFCEWIGKEAAG